MPQTAEPFAPFETARLRLRCVVEYDAQTLSALMTPAISALVATWHTVGTPVAMTALAFALGLLVIPLAVETRGERLPS